MLLFIFVKLYYAGTLCARRRAGLLVCFDRPVGWKQTVSYADDPVRRSILEVAADAQRDVDRHAEMCRQYAIQGYADIEYTDPEDYDEDRMDWRPWAYLKEVGLAD